MLVAKADDAPTPGQRGLISDYLCHGKSRSNLLLKVPEFPCPLFLSVFVFFKPQMMPSAKFRKAFVVGLLPRYT